VERFTVSRNENALFDLLDEEDREGIIFEDEEPAVDTFIEALRLIERYPWHRMTPLTVHADYLDTVMEEVERLGGSEHASRWRARLALL
jgi:hypothetical protein